MFYLNPLLPKLIFRHAGVDRLPLIYSHGAHRDLKFCSLPKFHMLTYMSTNWAVEGQTASKYVNVSPV